MFRESSGTKRILSASLLALAMSPALSGAAFAVVITNPEDPGPPEIGPSIPYISNRVSARQAPLPVGEVLPDDFCIEGKLDDCGDHLRDQDVAPFVGNTSANQSVLGDAEYVFWGEAQQRSTDQSTPGIQEVSTSFAIGVDRKMSERLIIGVMATSIGEETTNSVPPTIDRATGYMAGPYFAYQAGNVTTIDGRVLFGAASHAVDFLGSQTGVYDSTRVFAAIRGSAEIERENFRFYPSLEVSYYVEDAPAYTDTVFGPIAAETTVETFLTLGGTAHYDGFENSAFVPYVGLHGSLNLNGGALFGVARVGANLELENGGLINMEFVYGAIGLANVEDTRISMAFEFPF